MNLKDLEVWRGWLDAQWEVWIGKKWFLIPMMIVYTLPLLVVRLVQVAWDMFETYKFLWKKAKWR